MVGSSLLPLVANRKKGRHCVDSGKSGRSKMLDQVKLFDRTSIFWLIRGKLKENKRTGARQSSIGGVF
jgi:hypothetical protein